MFDKADKDGDGKWPDKFNNKRYLLMDSKRRYWETHVSVHELLRNSLDVVISINISLEVRCKYLRMNKKVFIICCVLVIIR